MGKQIHFRIAPLYKHPVRVFQYLHHRLQAEFAYRYPMEYAPAPKEVIFFLTYRCNLRCEFCGQRNHESGYVDKLPEQNRKIEVSVDRLFSVVDELSPLKTELVICGGESSLYEDWDKFVEYACNKQFKVTFITNGTNLEKHAEFLVKQRLHRLTVSIDGSENIHDKLRGKKGLFHDVINGIILVTRLKQEYQTDRPYIWTNCTISNHNQNNLVDLYNSIKSLQLDKICFQHLFHLDRKSLDNLAVIFHDSFGAECHDWQGYENDLDGLSIETLINSLNTLKSIMDPRILVIPDFPVNEIREYYLNPDFKSETYQWACKGPWRSSYRLPD